MFKNFRTAAIAALFAGALGAIAYGQAGFTLVSPIVIGHYINGGPPPTGTGCTITAGSTDTDGECATTATSGSIAFTTAYVVVPSCIVVDKTSAATVPQLTYTTTIAQITLTTATSAHGLVWHCASKQGG